MRPWARDEKNTYDAERRHSVSRRTPVHEGKSLTNRVHHSFPPIASSVCIAMANMALITSVSIDVAALYDSKDGFHSKTNR